MESIFGRPFIKVRPDFLKNKITGKEKNLELDCYNAELGIAVEYNGEQHYRQLSFFHKNKHHFQAQKYRDFMKRTLCEKAGVKLIEVPYTTKVEHIEDYIRSNLREFGFLV